MFINFTRCFPLLQPDVKCERCHLQLITVMSDEGHGVPESTSTLIMVLENYDRTSVINSPGVALKLRDLYFGGNTAKRDVLKFYRKRTSCSCLKKMHLEARKDIQKMGGCYHCLKLKECSTLLVCSRCGVVQYCSRECQVADWPNHKEGECDHFVCARKKGTMES